MNQNQRFLNSNPWAIGGAFGLGAFLSLLICVVIVLTCLNPQGSSADNVKFVSAENENPSTLRYHGERIYNVAESKTIDEAIANHVRDFTRLPKEIRGTLFSVESPIEFHFSQTQPLGNFLEFYPPAKATPEEIEALVFEACNRIPCSGWYQDRILISKKAKEHWGKMLSVNNGTDHQSREDFATTVFSYGLNCQNFPTDGTPPRVSIFREILETKKSDRLMALLPELKKDLAYIATYTEQDEKSKAMIALMANGQTSKKKEIYTWAVKLLIPDTFQTQILYEESCWPIRIHSDFSDDCNEWSTLIGERSNKASNKTLLRQEVGNFLGHLRWAEISTEATSKFYENSCPVKFESGKLEYEVKQQTIDGLEYVIVRFRVKP